MNSIMFRCEVLTPIFLSGANGQDAELRPSSIKGLMRFWWRALNGHFTIDELRDEESKIFGCGGEKACRSSFSLRVIIGDSSVICEKKQPLPHHTGKENCEYLIKQNSCKGNKQFNSDKCQKGRRLPSISSGTFFIELRGKNLEKLGKLFEITCLLGGFGKRSRRGFGSVRITGRKALGQDKFVEYDIFESLVKIFQLISAFNADYMLLDGRIILKKPESLNGKYPEYAYIEDIRIGQKPYSKSNANEEYPGFELLKSIGAATHFYFDKSKSNGAGNPRFSSPTYISVIKMQNIDFEKNQKEECYYPIISSLHFAPPNEISVNSVPLKNKFMRAILEKNIPLD